MRIAVTGATGNIGTAVLRTLMGAGHDVVGIARRLPPSESRYAGAEWHSIDLSGDDGPPGPALEQAFAGADAVIHLAWGFQPTHDIAYLERLAVDGTRAVLSAAATVKVPHVLHMSSVGAYSPSREPGDGPADELVTEDWPTEGVATSYYSRHKVAAERLVDAFTEDHPATAVTRMRATFVGQTSAGSGLLRYALPAAVPSDVIRLLPVLPIDRTLRLQFVHSDDVADAFLRAVESRATGAFNLAAPEVLDAAAIARVLGARLVHVPYPVVRTAVAVSWRLHVQQIDEGWLDMGYSLPLLDTTRARTELGWRARTDSASVLAEIVQGMTELGRDETPVLRRRSIAEGVREAWRGRPVAQRHRP